ncbi:hypothetical protein PGT21_015233 [Puccinia graminis f. sp. tritici]|uniref:Uncharacterized protein n=1 Tax=Puccinia graminis f. sp. tritici TaxID=56615 RepID=A0A5B0LKB8_PUCGR|nr:hypothetical protein PGT21_015233 [Puccinia graminis f. sp. tritici]KAA1068261.1 hypothetical protein PGTUg99_030399 [Puccinia graminis f. sp. tritici]
MSGQQAEEIEVEPYTTVIVSSDDLIDLFVKAHTKLTELLDEEARRLDHETTIRDIKIFEKTTKEIQTLLVESMARKANLLCGMLSESIRLQQLDTAHLRDGIKILQDIEETVEQSSSLVHSSWTLRDHKPGCGFQSEERAEELLKQYRAERVQSRLADEFYSLSDLLESHFALLPLPTHQPMTRAEANVKLGQLRSCIEDEEECKEDLIELYEMSPLGLVGQHCEHLADEISDLLEELLEFLSLHKDIHRQPLREFIPIVKLSRLFFNKIDTLTSNQSDPIAHMTLAQLLDLVNLIQSIPTELHKFYYQIKFRYQPLLDNDLRRLANLNTLFQDPIHLITSSLLDTQDTYPDLPPDLRAQFLQWYDDWQAHLSLATTRFPTAYKNVYSDFPV